MLLTRADSGKEMLECVQTDVCAVVRGAIEQGQKLARSRYVELKASVPCSSISIQADSDALRRVVLILVDNAVKYTPHGGVVKVDLTEERGFAVVSVADTGIGIAKDDIAHVFDRFWRADKARSREHGGAGLGLSIAKWVAEAHRGSISVESAPGQGSVFHLRVPTG
jgi:signal transduction histidine kinase